jgi:hypothetical protein
VKPDRAERLLILLLRLAGGVMLLAAPCALMPRDWMAAVNQWSGLPPLPAGPLVDYLARSASALYAVHGGVFLLASRDPRRLSDLVAYLGASDVLFGVALLGVDVALGMPPLWTLAEGPVIVAAGLAILYLRRRALAGVDSASPASLSSSAVSREADQ